MKVYALSYKVVYPAESEEEARDLLRREIEEGMDVGDYSDWNCELLPRDEATEWLYRSFEIGEGE